MLLRLRLLVLVVVAALHSPGSISAAEDRPGEERKAKPPSKERVAVAKCVKGAKGSVDLLVQQSPEGWKRVKPTMEVSSVDRLVCLPGFNGSLLTKSGVGVLLRGNLPQTSFHAIMDFSFDSSVILHKNADFDLDLTLLGGRVYLSNRKPKGKARVRLRFGPEVWDVTLSKPGTEVGVDLLAYINRAIDYRVGEEPSKETYLTILAGEVGYRVEKSFINYPSLSPPEGGAVVLVWNSKNPNPPRPIPMKTIPELWSKGWPTPQNERQRKLAKQFEQTLRKIQATLGGDAKIEASLREVANRKDDSLHLRPVALFALAALDEVEPVLATLAEGSPTADRDRDAAVFALRRWLGRSSAHAKRLFDQKKSGLLIDKSYTANEASVILALLHDLSDGKGVSDPKTQAAVLLRYMQHKRVAIRHLAYWVLLRVTRREVFDQPKFNAGWPAAQRSKALIEWKKALAEKPGDKTPSKPPLKDSPFGQR